MTILELIKKSATILSVEQVLDDSKLDDYSLNEEETLLEKNKTVAKMYELAKLVINEVASYSPLFEEGVFESKNKKIMLGEINDLQKILSIKNEQGENVKFRKMEYCLLFDEDGKFTISYQKNPSTNSIFQVISCYGDVGEDVFVAGLNSYYSLATGLYAEYNVYNAQYVDRLTRIKNLKVFSMPCRRWNG